MILSLRRKIVGNLADTLGAGLSLSSQGLPTPERSEAERQDVVSHSSRERGGAGTHKHAVSLSVCKYRKIKMHMLFKGVKEVLNETKLQGGPVSWHRCLPALLMVLYIRAADMGACHRILPAAVCSQHCCSLPQSSGMSCHTL
jgi:hypothetical protein